jgi:hypothetical protein
MIKWSPTTMKTKTKPNRKQKRRDNCQLVTTQYLSQIEDLLTNPPNTIRNGLDRCNQCRDNVIRDFTESLNTRCNDGLNVGIGSRLLARGLAIQCRELAGLGFIVDDHPIVHFQRVDFETFILFKKLGQDFGNDHFEILLSGIASMSRTRQRDGKG